MTDKEIIQKIIKLLAENDNILKVRGGKGYGVGHPIYFKSYPTLNQYLGLQEEEPEMQQEKNPVKISKAFKNKKRK